MKDPGFAKLVVFVNGLVPLALLASDAYQHQLGADPVNSALHTTGNLALIFLLLTLCITPARKLTGANWLSHFRRMLGLFAFFYALVHFSIYFSCEQAFSFSGTVADTFKRPFILYGMAALASMIPLAVTSTNGMIKRMGAAKWKMLHRLIYVAAICGIIHYWKLVKADIRKPAAYTLALAVLLMFRLVGTIRYSRPAAR